MWRIFVTTNKNAVVKSIITVLTILIFSSAFAVDEGKYSLAGVVLNNKTHKPVEFAAVFVEELGVGTLTRENGHYRLENIPSGTYHIVVQYLGYASFRKQVNVSEPLVLPIALDEFSLQLPEVNVMARYNIKNSSSVVIDQAALEYIQPSSLSDIFQLLPGNLFSDGNLNSANQLSSRQAGNDKNTALGMAIISNGVPLVNNAGITAMSGLESDVLRKDRSTLNGGVDVRQLSTDHVEEVEVIQGISSVKYGDLSSGVVVMKAKSGKSPLQLRVKADPLSKLAYIGKGFRLPGSGGTLHAGIDVLQAKPDVRDQLEKYTRISTQLNYVNRMAVAKRNLNYNLKFSHIGTLDREKNDPDLLLPEDSYSSVYNRLMLSFHGGYEVDAAWLNKLELTMGADYTADILKRKKTVSLNGAYPLPLSQLPGEAEGVYLPVEYASDFKVEDRPFGFYTQLSGVTLFDWKNTVHRILWGLENRIEKNLGQGAIYDPKTPPYPNMSSSSRPRTLRSVPAMVQTSVFLEDKIAYRYDGHKVELTLGVRLGNLSNLPDGYRLKGKMYGEPRLNLYYKLPSFGIGSQRSVLSFRAGYGEQVKFPTLDYLYPDKAYFDVIALNYYSQVPENRLLWINTSVRERVNPELNVNRNRKLEIGADWKIGELELSLTAFREVSESGYTYASNYFPVIYRKYQNPDVLPAGKPVIGDFSSRIDTLLMSYTTPANAVKVVKKGVEYQVVLPRIHPIRTEIRVNGGYYKTLYDVSTPMQYRPSSTVNGKPYPYAGIYEWNSESRYKEQVNTTLWANTHIPRFKLYFSTTLQVLWFTSSQSRPFSGAPVAYVGPEGVKPFTETEMGDSRFRELIQTFSDSYFKASRTPISVSLNVKATKEIGENLKVAFFVNRLWDYNPVYKTNLQTESRKWTVPFFGAELTLKI